MNRALLVAGAVLLFGVPAQAHAIELGLDLSGAFLTSSSKTDGFGAALRLGSALDTPGANVIVEIGGATTGFTNDTIHQLFGGARLGVGSLLRPGLYGHVGYGWLNHSTPTETADAPERVLVRDGSGLYVEGGLALDVVLPVVSFGAHVAYDYFVQGDFGAEAPGFVLLGVQAAVSF
jgi:hypothetical protein